jgi:DNA-binding MarR family transcriptional regulator
MTRARTPVVDDRTRAAAQAWSAMRSLVLDRNDRRAQVAERLQLSFIRAKALLHLAGEPLTMRELAAAIAIDAPYATVVVDDLERRGLVRRSPHPDDRRVKVVSLSPAGRRSAGIARRILDEPPAVLDRLSDEELVTLARIVSVLTADDEAAEQPS